MVRWVQYVFSDPLKPFLFQIEYVDLNTSKIGRVKLGVQQRIESMTFVSLSYSNYSTEPDLEKTKLSVQYLDKEKGVIVAADENYEQFEIPLKLAQGAEPFLEPGTTIGVSLDGGVPIKLALPANILALSKKQ